MRNIALITSAIALILAAGPLRAAVPLAPAQHEHATQVAKPADFASCYMDAFMRMQRDAIRRYGDIGGGLLWGAVAASGGAFGGLFAAAVCGAQ